MRGDRRDTAACRVVLGFGVLRAVAGLDPLVREERLVLLDDLAGVGVDEFAEVALAVRHVIGCASGGVFAHRQHDEARSEEHTSELQSLMRISYAVFCLKKNNKQL